MLVGIEDETSPSLADVPVDPITHKADGVLDSEGPILGDPVVRPDLQAKRPVQVHSNCNQISRDRGET